LRPQFYLAACRRYDQAEPGPPTVSRWSWIGGGPRWSECRRGCRTVV